MSILGFIHSLNQPLDPQTLLQRFVDQTTISRIIPLSIRLQLVNSPNIVSCDTNTNTIFLSRDIAVHYGTQSNETLFTQLIDSFPNDPEQLNITLLSLTQTQLDYIRSIISTTPSDLEVESKILHEIGHILFKHVILIETSQTLRHFHEFSADLFAYQTYRGRLGFTREYKRILICSFLALGALRYLRFILFSISCPPLSHPCNFMRLKQAVYFEQFMASLSIEQRLLLNIS